MPSRQAVLAHGDTTPGVQVDGGVILQHPPGRHKRVIDDLTGYAFRLQHHINIVAQTVTGGVTLR